MNMTLNRKNEPEFMEINGEPRDTLFDRLQVAVGDDVDSGEVCTKCGSSNKTYRGWSLYVEMWECNDCGKHFPTKEFNEDYKKRFGHYINDPVCSYCSLECDDRAANEKVIMRCQKYLEEKYK